MFTGIILEIGTVEKIEKLKNTTLFSISTKSILKDKKTGDSIAVNGVCVTVSDLQKDNFSFEAIEETLKRSNLGELKKGDEVNLEPSLKLGQALDGHIVQGHVDAFAAVEAFDDNKLRLQIPEGLHKYLAFKGSIAINGISLTISELNEDSFTVDLIPFTLENTNLKNLKIGNKVNLEVDMIARYLESLLNQKDREASYEFLKERNLL